MKRTLKTLAMLLIVSCLSVFVTSCDNILAQLNNGKYSRSQNTEPDETNNPAFYVPPDEVKIADCENGTIALHENSAWMFDINNPTHNDYLEAVGDEGYYFERWAFFDKDMNEVVDYAFGHLNGYGTPQFIEHWEMYGNYLSLDKVNGFIRDPWRNNETVGVFYLKAFFTNDPDKLVDVTEPPLTMEDKSSDYREITNYTTNTLPDNKVIGTRLWQYVMIDDADLQIVEVRTGMGTDPEYGGVYNIIVYSDYHNVFTESTYAYFDYWYYAGFESSAEWIIVIVDKI